MIVPLALLTGAALGVILAAAIFKSQVKILLEELALIRRDRDRLQSELHLRRNEAGEARLSALQSEHDALLVRRRLMTAFAERDEARTAQLNADAAYREILAERDRLLGELALSRRRRALP
ncbi:MAG: hypothetical protein AB4911_13595 [Oscillochloridaceae bacterium umkhey_bin13]